MRGIILEGVTGAGKSSTLGALLGAAPDTFEVFREEETLGEVMDELRDPSLDDEARCRRMPPIVEALTSRRRPFLLERFHPSYYALMPRVQLYDAIDAALHRLEAGLVLLHVPEKRLEERSFARAENPEWASGMASWFGSASAAIAAIRASQDRRLEYLQHTRLPSLMIDTTAKDWNAYATQIRRFLTSSSV